MLEHPTPSPLPVTHRQQPPATAKINWPLLGAVRFFLAFIVLVTHLKWFVATPDALLKFNKFSPVVAVLGFLVVSGFSIAASYAAQKDGFYFRRALRIVPIYLLGIAYSSLIILYADSGSIPDDLKRNPQNIAVIVGNLLFLQGIAVPSLNANPIVWTLSIEVFFYIATPLLSAKSKYFMPAMLVSAFLFAVQRYLGFFYYSQMLYGLGIAFLGWAWLSGFWYYHHASKSGAAFFLCCLGIAVITFNGFFITVFWTITWILVCAAVGYGHLLSLPCPKLLTLLGDISYPLYLLHIPIFLTLKTLGVVQNGILYFLIALVVCLGVDALLDKPLKRLIKAVLKKPSPKAA